jgi:hypothetical protein
MSVRSLSLLTFAVLALAGTSGALRAQAVGVQSITTTFTAGTNTTTEDLAGANVTFDDDKLSIVTMKDTSGNTYTANVTASSAVLRTDSTSTGEENQTSAWYMGAAGGGTATTVYGSYNSGNPASLLVGNNLLEGSDNLFINSSTTTASQGNVERLDFLYNGTTGETDNGTLAIGVFDRGTGDSFSIAVITGVDSNGNPTSYAGFETISNTAFTGGSLLTTASLSATASSTVLDAGTNPTDYLVRYDSSTSLATGNTTSDNTDNTQNVTGVVITLASLGISSGTKIYGYSLMGGDVTPGTNLSTLTNWSNTSVYPTTTTDSGAFDGLDPVAVNGVLFSMQAVPEPSTYAEVFLTAAVALWGLRRRKSEP